VLKYKDMSPENKHELLFTSKQDWSDVRSI